MGIQGYRPQQIEVATTNTEEMAVLKEVFRAMSPEERGAWLEKHTLREPSQKPTVA
jgi:hypothetical protein